MGPTAETDPEAVGSPAASSASLEAQLQRLEQARVIDLRAEWRRLFGTDPPRLSRDLLVRAIAYGIQERMFGGLSRPSLKRLREPAGDPGDAGHGAETPSPSLRPGAKLVREWHGRTHVVVVTETGFDYAGSTYRSLTQIARLITGAHWSGPRFFGLASRRSTLERIDV